MKNKEIREILMNNEVVFTVKGITEYNKKEDGTWGQVPKIFKTNKYDGKTQSIGIKGGFENMNVTKFGPTCVTLFTYDMLGNKTVGKMKYEDIIFDPSHSSLLESPPLKVSKESKLEKTKDSDGNIIQSGDEVKFNCRITNLRKKGVIHHMTGGSFGIADEKIRAIYKYNEVKTYNIIKIC